MASCLMKRRESCKLTDVSDEEAAGVVFVLESVNRVHHHRDGQALLSRGAGVVLLALHRILLIPLFREGCFSTRYPLRVRGAEAKDREFPVLQFGGRVPSEFSQRGSSGLSGVSGT